MDVFTAKHIHRLFQFNSEANAACCSAVPCARLKGAKKALKKLNPTTVQKEQQTHSNASVEVRHLRYAVAAEKFGSFRKAALALDVKQSTLSRTVAQMETRLGVDLFERTSSGISLTKAGAEIIRTSKYLVEAIDLLADHAREMNSGLTGYLRIGFYTSLSTGNLRASLVEFASKFPSVEIHAIEASRARLISNLVGGLVDIAIFTGAPSPSDGTAMSLWTERIMVTISDSHALAAKSVVHWSELMDETFLLSERDPGPDLQQIFTSRLSPLGVQPKIVQQDVSEENIRNLVGAGFGVGLALETGLGAKIPGVTYLEVRDENGPSRISFSAHWRSNNNNPALANFIALLEERYPVPRKFD